MIREPTAPTAAPAGVDEPASLATEAAVPAKEPNELSRLLELAVSAVLVVLLAAAAELIDAAGLSL